MKPKHIIEGTLTHGIWSSFQHYAQLLESRNVKPRDRTATDEDPLHPEHLLWMCLDMKRRMERELSYPVDKASRWLGFVQAGLIANKLTTIADERDRTRTWIKGENHGK